MRLGRLIGALAISLGVLVCGCTATGTYGPLAFNRAGSDFYFAQGGQFVFGQHIHEGEPDAGIPARLSGQQD